MRWDDVRSTSNKTLRLFALVWLPLGFLLIGYLVLVWGGTKPWAYGVWGAGAVLAIGSALSLKFNRLVFLGLSALTFPIGWVIFHAVLAIVYYGLITLFGLVMRLFGRDLLRLKRDPSATSFWIPRPPAPVNERYFRQF